MRIDVDEAARLGVIGRVRVFLDDVEVQDCVEADEERGYVIQYERGVDGRVKLSPCGTQIARAHCGGRVRIEVMDD